MIPELVAFFDPVHETFCLAVRDEERPTRKEQFVFLELPSDELFEMDAAELERKIGGSALAFMQITLGRPVCRRDYMAEADKLAKGESGG